MAVRVRAAEVREMNFARLVAVALEPCLRSLGFFPSLLHFLSQNFLSHLSTLPFRKKWPR